MASLLRAPRWDLVVPVTMSSSPEGTEIGLLCVGKCFGLWLLACWVLLSMSFAFVWLQYAGTDSGVLTD